MDELDDLDVIAIAQGILMHLHGVGAEDAGLMLLLRADRESRPLPDVAADVVRERDRHR